MRSGGISEACTFNFFYKILFELVMLCCLGAGVVLGLTCSLPRPLLARKVQQRTRASVIGAIVKEMIGEEGYFGDEGEAMSERSRGDEGLEYRYCETLALGMMLISSNEVYWGPFFGGSGAPVCTASSKKKKRKKERGAYS